jgi:hypothetical protein
VLLGLRRDEPGDWIDSSAEELRVYGAVVDTLLASLIDDVTFEVDAVLARRARR